MADNDKKFPTSEAHLVSSRKYFDVDAPVFWPSAILIVAFIAIILIVGKPMEQVFSSIQSGYPVLEDGFLCYLSTSFYFL